jgi:curved DNA-binding protein CbpA
MEATRDPYDVLSVPKDATVDQIRKKYRKLLRKFHPDVVAPDGDPEMLDYANRMTAEINAAWEILSDPVRRAEHDRVRTPGRDKDTDAPSAHPGGIPKLEVWPPEIVISDVDPDDGIVTFSITLQQVGGAPFDPDVHELFLIPAPPWDGARVRKLGQDADRPPMTIELEVDASDIGMRENTTYSGEFEVVVEVKG